MMKSIRDLGKHLTTGCTMEEYSAGLETNVDVDQAEYMVIGNSIVTTIGKNKRSNIMYVDSKENHYQYNI